MVSKINFTARLTVFVITFVLMTACNNAQSQPKLQGTIADNYPLLATTPLATAQFADLPRDILLRSGNVSISKSELEQEIGGARESMRKQLEDNAFFILEQKFTEQVILEESRNSLSGDSHDVDGMTDVEIIQTFISAMIENIEPSDEEIRQFYEANKELMGGMPLDRVSGQIKGFLTQQKQQDFVQEYVTNVLSGRQVEISDTWAAEKIPSALDNDIDKARLSGKPTMANFGSDGCVPCQMMIPAREAVIEKYGDQAHVVYIHVDRDQILSSRYGVQSIPTLIFFDKQGVEYHSHIGMMSQEEMEEHINKLLNQ